MINNKLNLRVRVENSKRLFINFLPFLHLLLILVLMPVLIQPHVFQFFYNIKSIIFKSGYISAFECDKNAQKTRKYIKDLGAKSIVKYKYVN